MISKVAWLISGLLLGIAVVTLAHGSAASCDDFARQCLSELVAKARQRGWIGVEFQHLDSQLGHLEVTRVTPDSPAAQAGLRKGDLVVGIGDATFETMTNFDAIDALAARTIAEFRPGKTVEVRLERGPAEITVALTPAPYERHALAEFIGGSLMRQFPELVEAR